METPELAADAAVEAALSIPELKQPEPEEPAEEQVEESEEEEVQYPKLVEDEEEEAEDSEEAEETDEEESEETEGVALPEGYADVGIVDASELATQFKVMDAEGEIEIPALEIEYKANGKVRRERLDQVVKLAQWGVYNEDKDKQAKQAMQEAQSVKSERDQYEQLVAEREQQIERLLQDDDYLYRVRERYQSENSPEQRARRAEERVQRLQAEQQLQYIEQRGTQFFKGEVEPAIQTIADALPNVTADELAERMVMSLQPHLRQGPLGDPYIPEESYDAVRNYIVDDLVFWAQMQDSRRGGAATSPEMEEAQQQLEEARIQAQKAKRAVGKKTRPVGKAAADKKGRKAKSINNVDDAVDSALENVLASL